MIAADVQDPWLVAGDFNVILSREERLLGADPHTGAMEDFATALLDCGLLDAGFEGNKFTWTNSHMFQRLDRVVYNSQWGSQFPTTRIQHLNRDGSDHCPLLISCANSNVQRPSSFRFLHCWVKHHGFLEFVANNWNLPMQGIGMNAFWLKQQRLKKALKGWNKYVFGDIFSNLRAAEKQAEESEKRFQEDQSPANRESMHLSYARLNHLLSVEEAYWQQKSGVKWLVEGENNTRFFHMRVQKKRMKNYIFRIENNDGSIVEDQKLLKSTAVDYFANLLQADSSDNTKFNASLIPCLLTDHDNDLLCAVPTMSEVKEAVFGIDKDSVAGPDGFSSLFYQHCWSIIANDLLYAVKDFFRGARLPKGVTSTTLILLPKKSDAIKWKDFRPISLCTVLNKIITKLLANRLSTVLPSLISENQSGFVKGRLISDNILLAQELIGKLDYKSRGGNVVLKLDMMKAYDRINWDFLYLMMEKFGFNAHWIDMIKRCISNCWFSLLINGQSVGYFKSERGLRQGDAISPLLFILAAEYLSRGLNNLFSQFCSLHYQSGCSINISHLAFADDVMIFTNGSKAALQKVLTFLQEYEQISGQKLNPNKSNFITSNSVSSSRCQIIAQATGFQQTKLPITYLGAPLHKGPKKVLLFDSLINKIRDRITGWENKVLSPGGRITLLRSVLSSMPIYLLQVIKPPVTVIERIERIFNSFIWGGSLDSKKMHWTAWGKIALPCSEGGLGIRNLTDVFEAFSAKLLWKFQTCNNLWTRYMKARYCTGQLPHKVTAKPHDSPTWKRMLIERDITGQQIRWRLGKGDLFFWHDIWFGDDSLVTLFPSFSNSMIKVHYFFHNNEWDVNKLRAVVTTRNLPQAHDNRRDVPIDTHYPECQPEPRKAYISVSFLSCEQSLLDIESLENIYYFRSKTIKIKFSPHRGILVIFFSKISKLAKT
ncbi:Reverse transcriptase domain - like 10 [Theobroma cacao]|nr:Reverse transcriptase domain - like 10 [Theobroma cacao]